jgi:spore maturation protein CgeB/GT2 family glycosyltransferase
MGSSSDPPPVPTDGWPETEGIEELRARVDELERELAYSRELVREVIATSNAQAAELKRARSDYRRLRGRRPVRLMVAVATRGREIVGRIRSAAGLPRAAAAVMTRPIRERRRIRRLQASPAAGQALVSALRQGGSQPPPPDYGPLVSIVIVQRDGVATLERCLRGLAPTTYRDVEIIVVGDGTADLSALADERLAGSWQVKLHRSPGGASFQAAASQGIAIAHGSLLCFLDVGIEPITADWLGYLVETMNSTDVAAAGARLIYARHPGGPPAGARHAELTLAHGGFTFDRGGGIPTPRSLGEGEDPMAPDAVGVGDRAALSLACLLVRRSMVDAVGGISDRDGGQGARSGTDLSLRLRAAGGRLVYDGRAALWQREPAQAASDGVEALADAWGPRLFREAMVDTLTGRGRLSSAPFHVAITLMSLDPDDGFGDWYTGHELGDALGAIGWRVTYLERKADGWYDPDPSVEAVIVLLDTCDIRRLPRTVVTMAWVRSWPERWLERAWFDEYDIVFGSSDRIAAMVREGSSKVATMLPLATNPDRFGHPVQRPELACDVLFVGNYWSQPRGVVEALPALTERGLSVRVHGRRWDEVPAFSAIDRGFIAYEDIPDAYASARVVIDDAAISTKGCASVNSRVFDALAAGAVVVSNGALGVHDLFDDGFPTWSDARSLVELVEGILGDPDRAAEEAGRYRGQVLQRHRYADRAATIRDSLEKWASATRYALRIGVPSWDVIERWGDYHLARALQRSLERAGHPTRLQFLPEWGDQVAAREDVTVHVFGLKEAPVRPGQVNLLWQISHPDLATPAMYDRYDHVFVASDAFAARMASLTDSPVTSLHQATDPERFRPDPTGPHHELLFVANSRHVRRRIVDDLAGTTHDLAVYGRGWVPDLIDPRFVMGEGIPNEEVRRYYSSADIVLNDHWDDMRERGFMSNRLYDALACGAFVVSDHIEGVEDEFDGAVVTYRVREELEALIVRYLAQPAERRRLAERGRHAVLERHTFDLRARVLCESAGAILDARAAAGFAEPTSRSVASTPARMG